METTLVLFDRTVTEDEGSHIPANRKLFGAVWLAKEVSGDKPQSSDFPDGRGEPLVGSGDDRILDQNT